jgi:hypothetical protein
MRRPTRDPYARPAIQTLERLHAELGGKILENRQQGQNLLSKCAKSRPSSRCWNVLNIGGNTSGTFGASVRIAGNGI